MRMKKMTTLTMKMTNKTNEPQKSTDTKKEEKRPEHKEINGPKGLEPTRFGDWEKNGRCTDF